MDQMLNEIDRVKQELKKKYSNWRVKVANAKSVTDMQINGNEPGDEMKWHVYFLDNLKEQL